MDLNPSLSWERLNSTFYRSRELQSLEHEPVAIDISLYLSVEQNKTIVYTYTNEIQLTIAHSTLPADHLKSVLEDDCLVIILRDRIRMFKSLITSEFDDIKILGTDNLPLSIWDYKNGIVITTDFKLFQVADGKALFPHLEFSLLLKDHWFTNRSEIVILDSTGKVFIGDINTGDFRNISGYSGWYKGCISDQGFVCLINAKLNNLIIFKDEFKQPLIEVQLDELPNNIAWCSSDIICCNFGDNEVRLIGSEKDYASFWYPSDVYNLQTCLGGIKIITKDRIHFISKVPQSTSNIFRIGSTESGAILLDSMNLLYNENNSPKAIENLKIINVKKAVDECILAAGDEISSIWQKRLLSAASFGKDSLSSSEFNSSEFVETCDHLKVLNFLQSFGIYLTLPQFKAIGIEKILSKLLRIGKIYECFQIIKFLRCSDMIPIVFSTWAKDKILSSDESDEELYTYISERGRLFTESLPFSRIGYTAFLDGRYSLARKLALNDDNLVAKISLLLKLDELEIAVKEASDKIDIFILAFLLLYSKQNLTNAQFTKLLMHTLKDNQLYQYIERDNSTFLYDYYRQTDSYLELAELIWERGRKEGQEIVALLSQVSDLFTKLGVDNNAKRDKRLVDRARVLTEYQADLTNIYGINFQGLTSDETLMNLIKNGQHSEVKRMILEFKISERKYYYLKCVCLAKENKLKELQTFAQEKKSPVGYLPFYKAVVKFGHKKDAAVYVRLLNSATYSEKLEMYLDCDAFSEAINLASHENDAIGLKSVLDKIPPNETQLRSLAIQSLHGL